MKCFALPFVSLALLSLPFAAACSSGSAASSSSSDASSTLDGTTDASSGSNDAGTADSSEAGSGGDGGSSDGSGEVTETGCTTMPAYDPAWDGSTWDEDAATPDGGDTWDGYVHGFFEKYCVECHHSGAPTLPPANVPLDFTQHANVVSWENTIRCGVIPATATQDPSWSCATVPPPGQFPIYDTGHCNTKPTDAERWRVVTWIDAGSP